MGIAKKALEGQLISISGELIEHLVKLYMFPDTEYTEHWRAEVYNFLHKSPKLKGTNKPPKAEFIYSCISGYIDEIDEIMQVIATDCTECYQTRFDSYEAEQLINDYLLWLSMRLSESAVLSSSEIFTKLEELTL